MGQRSWTTGFMVGAVSVSAGLTTLGLGSAPISHATCASFFGIGNSANCTSNLTSIAIAIGPDAIAKADGKLAVAVAVGDSAVALTDTGAFLAAVVFGKSSLAISSGGNFNSATALGNRSYATALNGSANLAFATSFGDAQSDHAIAGTDTGSFNVAVALGGGNGDPVAALIEDGSANFAAAAGTNAVGSEAKGGNFNRVIALGTTSSATTFSGSNNQSIAIGASSTADVTDGDGNQATAIGLDTTTAVASYGDGNHATAIGDQSFAGAGDPDKEVLSNNNRAFVFGRNSRVLVGPGDNNRLRIIGDNARGTSPAPTPPARTAGRISRH